MKIMIPATAAKETPSRACDQKPDKINRPSSAPSGSDSPESADQPNACQRLPVA